MSIDLPKSHREMAADVADMVDEYPSSEFTVQFLAAGVLHALLALVDELEDLRETLAEVRGT